MLSFTFSCTERINTSQCVHPTPRWQTVFLRKENRRLQGANAIRRQPLPNSRQNSGNERHASVPWKRRRARTVRSSLFQERAARCTRARVRRWRNDTTPPRAFDGRGRASIHNSPSHFHGRATAGQYSCVIGQFVGRPRLPHPVTSPFRSSFSEEVFGSNEEDLDFLQVDFDTWVPRI
ncbi:hypothetical protein TcCL_ESM05630 [Trypanosoma cruzi]|nr:hypothetical protein TcCL_ESM05630 [Trypanosoma cruzi]